MSQRTKKSGKVEDSNAAVGKRRRRRPSGSDGGGGGGVAGEEDAGSNSGGNGPFPSSLGGMWTPRHLNDLKVSSIYNRNSAEAPAELYRKDLISAMKLADSEPLTPEEYWLITDPWKQEWEKGVQVPVNPESLPEPEVVVISPVNERSHDFRLPKKKYIRVTHDDFFNPDYHQLVSTAARAEKVCSYDLDDIDSSWLSCANSDRGMQSLPVISEFLMEQVIEELELQCWEQVQTILKSQEGLGIEYDENVICDVCRSPESEEGNEMVFCDSCNICVHQACYGITTIPSGSWLCRTCTLSIRPPCVLCPNMGGAMKATRSGQKWAHVACAIWIPEVSIGSVEKMEPITKISAIPQSRWSLICVICKDKAGACIQCSVKTCKTAYHVTCAFKNGLEMKPIIVDENAEDGIKLRSYCQKHSVNPKKDKSPQSGSEEDLEKKKLKAMTAEERNQARAEKLQLIESEFYKYVRLKDVAQNLAVDMDIVMLVFNFWKLKRKSLNNRPLVPPRPETTQLLTQQQEQDLEQMKMFVQLRQDLERVRNLCYMVSRREKLSRTYFRLREQTFQKQVAILGEKSIDSLNPEEKSAIVAANRGTSIYDQIYSSFESTNNNALKDYDTLVSLIAGEEKKEKLVNGVIKPKKSSSGGLGNMINSASGSNPFKKQFVNGARKKNLIDSSLSESEASVSDATVNNALKKKLGNSSTGRKPLSYLFDSDSSADGGGSMAKDGTTTKDNKKQTKKKSPINSRGRGQKATKKSSTSDSDDLELPLQKAVGNNLLGKSEGPIYSDSESDGSLKRRPGSPVATKAAVKEFTRKSNKKVLQGAKSVAQQKKAVPPKQGKGGRKKKGAEPTEQLIVPQREAAKKATENIRSVKPRKDGLAGDNASSQDSVASPATFNDRESESFEKTAMEKFKDIAAASVQDKIKKRNDKSKPATAENRRGGANKKSVKSENVVSNKDAESAIHGLYDELRDQYEFDGSNDSKNVPNFVPQRQAAKKAAEHIRSGLSNIVAARLIIEDEMEATRKKGKGDRTIPSGKTSMDSSTGPTGVATTGTTGGKKQPNRSRGKSPFIDKAVENSFLQTGDSSSSKQRSRKRVLSKGEDKGTLNKSGRKETAAGESTAEVPASDRQTDWPFLDRGTHSQSACRRSRERSSSSSSSSSSGSSSGSGSSSSSRSSTSSSPAITQPTPASASPESIAATPRKTSPLNKSISFNPPAAIVTTSRGPSRKLKTSDRSPDGGPRIEVVTGKKPPPKSRGPSKVRPGGGTVGNAHQNSTKHDAPASSTRSDDLRIRRTKTSSRGSSSSSDRRSPSPQPSRTARVTQKNNKPAQAKGKRGKGESSAGGREKEKNCITPATPTTPSKSNAKSNQARAAAKALSGLTATSSSKAAANKAAVSSISVSGTLELSSDSEEESKPTTLSPDKNNSHSQQIPPSSSSTDSRNLRATARAKKKSGVSNLSDSDSELADEKENSCRATVVPPPSVNESPSTNTRNRTPKQQGIPSSAGSILSPLTPSSENKEKDLKSSDLEPDVKRARFDSGASVGENSTTTTATGGHANNNQVPVGPNSGSQLFSATATAGSLLSAKSLFSPRAGHENDLVDFDSELYDLARSVSADYSQVDEEGGAAASSLPFFAQSFLSREQTVEDSPQATLNLVEKLRLQHARKSGYPRSSIDGSDLSLSEDPPKSPTSKPGSSLADPSSTSVHEDEKICDVSNQENHPEISPDRDKLIEGDERWVPPSSRSLLDHHHHHHPEHQQQISSSSHSPEGRSRHHPIKPPPPHIVSAELVDNRYKLRRSEDNIANSEQQYPAPSSSRHHLHHEDLAAVVRQPLSEQKSSSGDGHNKLGDLSVSLTSPTMSPMASPVGVRPSQQHSGGVLFPQQVSSSFPTTTGSAAGPHSLSNSSFMYPLSSTGASSVAAHQQNVAVPTIDPNNPRSSSFFHHQAPNNQQHPQISSSSLSPGYPRQNFPGAHHIIHGKQQQQQQSANKESIAISSPTTSPPVPLNNQRTTTPTSSSTSTPFLDEDSIASVTSGMPPLAKPSIASPSMILAANNVKNITPPPPPQSTVAQIIENVVNNHANNNSTLAAHELLNVMLGLNAISSCSTSTPMIPTSETFKPSSSLLATEIVRNEIAESEMMTRRKSSVQSVTTPPNTFAPETAAEVNMKPDVSAGKSPRGRGRRATTPRRGSAKNEKILTNCETNGVKPKGRNERKAATTANNNTSPQPRTKAPAASRGRGRGKGRGKGMVATRKDLAGTVYDIDFDEFEENVDEKMDLRMLRERRKSSDLHTDNNRTCKSEHSRSPSGESRLGSLEMASPKYRDMDANQRPLSNIKIMHQSQVVIANENTVPILQPHPTLPGPVDMRTYNISGGAGGGSLLEISAENRNEKTDHPRISIYSSGMDSKGSLVNEIDDLDDTLDAFTSSSSAPNKEQPIYITLAKGTPIPAQQQQFPSFGIIDPAHIRRQGSGGDSLTDTHHQPSLLLASRELNQHSCGDSELRSTTDFSRNQLKVKIKGPFLDANYGSHSMGDSGGTHYQNSMHHPVGPSQIVVPASNTSNLRRMRKKELLRQYWNQDMNMDGGPSHDAEMSHSSMVHRSIITIPKAVASMAIIPTKDDYRESLPNEDLKDLLATNLTGLPNNYPGKGGTTEKRKRNRGIREMAALGIITCDTPIRERRRDRPDNNTPNFSSEMSKKRAKANKKPIRSTFIPPTLVDSDHSNNDKKGGNSSKIPGGGGSSSSSVSLSQNTTSAVVTAVNHPTPKLKIKFGDLSRGPTGASSTSLISNHALSDSSDKEAPNKKAKGRPPKKRGISDLTSAAPPTMEDLKRESMKFREMVMQDFAVEERKEILQLHGTRRHKKHKRKGGAASSETDDGSKQQPASEVKVIADGSTKLILRFGKCRANVMGGDVTKSRDADETSEKDNMEDVCEGENDSGFTGSSEGSSGSIIELPSGASKERLSAAADATSMCTPLVKIEPHTSSSLSVLTTSTTTITNSDANFVPPTTALTTTTLLQHETLGRPNSFSDLSKELPPDVKPLPESCSFQSDKIMPIRLKLSRCFEGYALKNKQENCNPVDTPPAPAKQSDSCEVR